MTTRCRCRHIEQDHGLTRAGKILCHGSSVCGCAEFRPAPRPTPVQHRDGMRAWDDDSEPRRSVDMGAHRVDVWPEPYEVAE